MDIKLDENLSRHLKKSLSQYGHDVVTAYDERLLGKSDIEIGNAAKTEGRMLFTLDVEFADLRKYPAGNHPGVILFRPESLGPTSVNRHILDFVNTTDLSGFKGCVVIVEPMRVRVRGPSASGTDNPE